MIIYVFDGLMGHCAFVFEIVFFFLAWLHMFAFHGCNNV